MVILGLSGTASAELSARRRRNGKVFKAGAQRVRTPAGSRVLALLEVTEEV